jgi:hypothetical protein
VRKEAEENARREAEEQARKEAEEQQAEEQVKKEALKQAKREAEEEQVRKEAGQEQARKEAEEKQARKEAEEQHARKEVEEEEQARKEVEEEEDAQTYLYKLDCELELRHSFSVQQEARNEAEEQARKQAEEEQARKETEEQARLKAQPGHIEHSDDEAEEIYSDEEAKGIGEEAKGIGAANGATANFDSAEPDASLAVQSERLSVCAFFDGSAEDEMIMHSLCSEMIQAAARGWCCRHRRKEARGETQKQAHSPVCADTSSPSQAVLVSASL